MSLLDISCVVVGRDMQIGAGFSAKNFDEHLFAGQIDPVVMLDHFHMTRPTFLPHPHAGISAVTYVFEDATSPHVNYDSLGNYGPIHPGSLHWFAAGRGAVHTEQPEGKKPHVHALQIFVNLPAHKKTMAPFAVHLESADIPEFNAPGVRVRVVLGDSSGVHSPATAQLPEPFTLLDGFLSPNTCFSHKLPLGWSAMIYAVEGQFTVLTGGRNTVLAEGSAIGVTLPKEASEGESPFSIHADTPAHFVVLSGPALHEPIVKNGPFVMNTEEQIHQVMSDFGKASLVM